MSYVDSIWVAEKVNRFREGKTIYEEYTMSTVEKYLIR